eukprot:GHVU01061480.1.p2 GENE.GHVU01061480.1~~GHVU01061480.1.p2  ORF type:complete len:217 (+),score=39.31 GHVU01061480.1:3992-4642(+)
MEEPDDSTDTLSEADTASQLSTAVSASHSPVHALPAFASEANRALHGEINETRRKLKQVDVDIAQEAQREEILKSRLKFVQDDTKARQKLLISVKKKAEVDDQASHLRRQNVRTLQAEIKQKKAQIEVFQQRRNDVYAQVFKNKEEIEAFKHEMQWNEERLQHFRQEAEQKEVRLLTTLAPSEASLSPDVVSMTPHTVVHTCWGTASSGVTVISGL